MSLFFVILLSVTSYCLLSANGHRGHGAMVSALTAQHGVISAGPRRDPIDVRDFGAKCDAVSDDSASLQAALNEWSEHGGKLVSPPGRTCVFRTNLVASFHHPDSWSSPHILDLQAGRWVSKVPSGIAFQLINDAPGEVNTSQIELTNGIFWESGGASLAIDFDGGRGPRHYMSDVLLVNLHIHTVGPRTSGVRFKSVFQTRCWSSTVSGFTAPGTYGWWFSKQDPTDEATGDFTWVGCDSTGYDHGIYSSGVNELRIFGGTYLQSWEENIFIDTSVGTVITDPHVENGWYGNPSPAPQRAELYCAGCYLDGVVGHISKGNSNAAVKLYVSAGSQHAGIRGGYFWGLSPTHPFAFVGTGPNGLITVEGWSPDNIRDYVGSSQIRYVAHDAHRAPQHVTEMALTASADSSARLKQLIIQWDPRHRVRIHQLHVYSNVPVLHCSTYPVITLFVDDSPVSTATEADRDNSWNVISSLLPVQVKRQLSIEITNPAAGCQDYGSPPHILIDYDDP